MSKTSTVIDLELVRQNVASEKVGEENLYHELDYLNTNVHIPVLKEFLDRIDNPLPGDNIEILRKEFESKLYKVLDEWAYRDSKTLRAGRSEVVDGRRVHYAQEYTGTLGIARKHAEVKDAESKQEFIDFCANITSSNENQWNHNQAEKVAAVTLRALMRGKDIEEVKAVAEDARSAYAAACVKQCSKDIKRDGVLLDFGKTPCIIFNEADLNVVHFPELTGEQLGFVKTLYDQGKFTGAVNSVVSNELAKDPDNPNTFLPFGSKVSISIKKREDGKVYVLSTAHYYKQSDIVEAITNEKELKKDQATNVTMITDITALSGERFAPGCGTAAAPTRIVMKGLKQKIHELSIPKAIQTSPNPLDNKLAEIVTNFISLKDASIAQAKNEATNKQYNLMILLNKEMERRKFFATSANDNPEDRLVNYFSMQLKSGTIVNDQHKNQMKDDVILILAPLVKDDKAKQRALRDVAGSMVRDCVAIASSEDSTVKLSFGQKIRHIVVDGLKSLLGLSKEKKDLKDIVAGHDFANTLKATIAQNNTIASTAISQSKGNSVRER